MFRKVTRSMFDLARYYHDYWYNRSSCWKSKQHRISFSQHPIPVKINIDELDKSFQNEYNMVKETIHKILPNEIAYEIENIVHNGHNFKANLWAKIVYNYVSIFKDIYKDESKVYLLLDTLKTLWIGRFVSYARRVEEMDINQAEKIIQLQADVFEQEFDYLKNIYYQDGEVSIN